jgi:hypothetical protein
MKFKLFLLTFFILSSKSISFASFPVQTEKVIGTSISLSQPKNPVLVSPAASGGKSQIAALLLCWFVGIIGIHRFYLGYTWQGIVQILTLGGLGIWTLVDLIRIITGDLKPKDGEYGSKF